MALEIAKSYKELIDQAKEAELSSDLEKAAKYYEKASRLEPLEPFAYNRLMIIYRKEKNYNAELVTINRGIEKFLQEKQKREEKFNKKNKQAAKLSKSLLKALATTVSNSDNAAPFEPLLSWQKRKQVVEQKLSQKTSSKKKKTK